MKCKNCKTENILKADYCKACGRQFTEKEKERAYDCTIFGIIDKISDLWSYITLDKITSSRWFRAAALIIIILYSFVVLKVNGNQLKIMDSRDYNVEYNKTEKEYYIKTDEQEVALNLYVPQKVQNINVLTVDKNDQLLSENQYTVDEQIVLQYDAEYHYVIQGDKQQLELFVVLE